jgi:hypothetical protein
VLPLIRRVLEEWDAAAAKGFSPEERQHLEMLLGRMTANLEEEEK